MLSSRFNTRRNGGKSIKNPLKIDKKSSKICSKSVLEALLGRPGAILAPRSPKNHKMLQNPNVSTPHMGPKNRPKSHKNLILAVLGRVLTPIFSKTDPRCFNIFEKCPKRGFRSENGSRNRSKIDPKSRKKRFHIDLTLKMQKVNKNGTPLSVFNRFI